MHCNIKILVVTSNAVQSKKFNDYFKTSKKIKAEVLMLDGIKAEKLIKEKGNDYNVIVLEVDLPNKDGITIVNNLHNNGYENKYILISECKTNFLRKITTIVPTIEAIFIKPQNIKDIEDTIIMSLEEVIVETKSELEIKSIISKQLHKLGMPAHIKGYQYIREGIYQMFNSKDGITKITKDLYPLIAKKYNTTPSRVERAIRHSIEVSWSRGDYEVMDSIFGNSVDFERSKPTNSEFISSVADAIILENKLKRSANIKEASYN